MYSIYAYANQKNPKIIVWSSCKPKELFGVLEIKMGNTNQALASKLGWKILNTKRPIKMVNP